MNSNRYFNTEDEFLILMGRKRQKKFPYTFLADYKFSNCFSSIVISLLCTIKKLWLAASATLIY